MKRVIVIVITLAIIAFSAGANAQMFAMTFGNRESAWTPAELNPIAWYKGDGNALDAMGNHDGTWTGTEAYADGPTGQAFDFDGTSRVVTSQALGNIEPGASFTVSLLAKSAQIKAMDALVSKIRSVNNDILGWGLYARSGDLYLGIFSRYSNGSGVTSLRGGSYFDSDKTDEIWNGAWQHITWVINGATGYSSLYLNGNKQPIERDWPSETGIINDRNFVIGGIDSFSNYFNGQLDDVLIFDRTLTAEEITKLYNESINKNGKAW